MNTATFAAADPVPARILGRDESTGTLEVELPILTAGTIDLSRTAGKGAGSLTITADMLNQVARNLTDWPGPVPVRRAPHVPFEETHGPAEGFLEAITVRGNQAWGRFRLNGDLAREFAADQWRGFSVDLVKDPKLPSRAITGWAVWGGVFTNRPASDVSYRVAASIETSDAARVQLTIASVAPARKEPPMPSTVTSADPARRSIADLLAFSAQQLENANVELASARARLDRVSRQVVLDAADVAQRQANEEQARRAVDSAISVQAHAKIAYERLREARLIQFSAQVENRRELSVVLEQRVSPAPVSVPLPVAAFPAESSPGDSIGPEMAAELRKLGLRPEYAGPNNSTEARQVSAALGSVPPSTARREYEDAQREISRLTQHQEAHQAALANRTLSEADCSAELTRLGLDPKYALVSSGADLPVRAPQGGESRSYALPPDRAFTRGELRNALRHFGLDSVDGLPTQEPLSASELRRCLTDLSVPPGLIPQAIAVFDGQKFRPAAYGAA